MFSVIENPEFVDDCLMSLKAVTKGDIEQCKILVTSEGRRYCRARLSLSQYYHTIDFSVVNSIVAIVLVLSSVFFIVFAHSKKHKSLIVAAYFILTHLVSVHVLLPLLVIKYEFLIYLTPLVNPVAAFGYIGVRRYFVSDILFVLFADAVLIVLTYFLLLFKNKQDKNIKKRLMVLLLILMAIAAVHIALSVLRLFAGM